MRHKLNIEMFYFNHETDYLPYFKPFILKMDSERMLFDLLESVRGEDEEFDYPARRTLLRVNSILVEGTLGIGEAVERFGTQWRIEPASTYRATHHLRFSDGDFMQKYDLLAPYCDEDDYRYYRTLYRTYYASEALEYNQDYIGDALMLLARRLIEKSDTHRNAVLDAVSGKENGFWLYEYECNTYPVVDLRETREYLQTAWEARGTCQENPLGGAKRLMTKLQDRFAPRSAPAESSSMRLLCERYGIEAGEGLLETLRGSISSDELRADIQHRFEGFGIAYYFGPEGGAASEAEALIEALGGQSRAFARERKANGTAIAENAKEIALEKAGNILLDALDSGAEILAVDSDAMLPMFDVPACAKAVGREIDLQVLSASQLVAIALGTTDKKALGIDSARANVTLI